jgi:hypothetical protein
VKNNKHAAPAAAVDLFGCIPVLWSDVLAWCQAVARIAPDSPRLAAYVRAWDVPGKIARAKAEGTFWSLIEAASAPITPPAPVVFLDGSRSPANGDPHAKGTAPGPRQSAPGAYLAPPMPTARPSLLRESRPRVTAEAPPSDPHRARPRRIGSGRYIAENALAAPTPGARRRMRLSVRPISL